LSARAELAVRYSHGTHRLVPPAQTLARIAPVLATCGITRCTSVTHLDELGVPVYCAIRPAGIVLQVSNGKGLTDDAARVSALMEAIELHHAEHPDPARLRTTSLRELLAEGAEAVAPPTLPGWSDALHFSDDFRCEWLLGESLTDGRPVWAPASLACFARRPAPLVTDSNGLASGNHITEASLHALYELLERDAISALSVNGRLRIKDRCRHVRPQTIPDDTLRGLLERIDERGSKVVLLWVPGRVPVHTFWAVLLNRRARAAVSTLNIGAGCHVDPLVAAARAVTEAVQSRLVFIHGAREDLLRKPVEQAAAVDDSAAYRYFDRLQPDTDWDALPPAGTDAATLEATWSWLLGCLDAAGIRVLRFDLCRADIGIPVVKLVAPQLSFNMRLF